MDPQSGSMLETANGFKFDENFSPTFEQTEDFINDCLENDAHDMPLLPLSPSLDNNASSPNVSNGTGSLDDTDPVLKFLNQILIEENMEERPSMFHDPLALRATEKSLYEAIGKKYPPSPYNPENHGDQMCNIADDIFGNPAEYTNSSNPGFSCIDPQLIIDPGGYSSSVEQGYQLEFQCDSFSHTSTQLSPVTVNSTNNNADTLMNPFEDARLLKNMFTNTESILQFQKGMEEASKFLPPSHQLIIDLDKYNLPQKSDGPLEASANIENYDNNSRNGLKGRKHQHPEDCSEDVERSSKQSAIYLDEDELSEMFDRVLLCNHEKDESASCNGDTKLLSGVEQPNESNSGIAKGDYVDLSTLLIRCAESVAADDRTTAYDRIKQISQYSSPTGNAEERMASVFVTGLQARLGGTGSELYASLTSKKITAAEKLKAYQVYLSACPFEKMSIFFADMMIGSVASEATTLHIIDFGVLYGFQWPSLIHLLSERASGPPKLRITGIELPQPGFKPAERVEETGSRLATYCKRFGVPFQYRAIASQNWETIKLEDLKIARDEVLVVNCLFRFDKLLDDTVAVDNPRDAVLNLIRKMKPDLFVNAVINGSYGVPMFVTRFKEALFHYSALFDMLDATLSRANPQRMDFEQEFYRREVINAIACEGAERVERPETYKKWHARHLRSGFTPLPLNQEIVTKLRNKVKAGYHKDFLFGEDGPWMLQGWKGRIICASSCWIPS